MPTNFTTTPAVSASVNNRVYTLSALENAVLHAWGGSAPATLTAVEVVNDALDWLANQHEWTWLQRPLSLNFTADQSFVTLPADFKHIHTLVYASAMNVATAVSIHEISLMRANSTASIVNGLNYRYAIVPAPQAATTALPTWRLELHPTPTAAATGALLGVYMRLIPALTGSADLPDIPAQYHRLLKNVCRAMAVSQQTMEGSEDWRIVNEELEQAKASDGLSVDSLGSMVGTIRRPCDDFDFPTRGTIIYP